MPVEIIKEVPVYKEGKTKTKTIVKEVPVEKIVEVTKEVVNTDEIKKLIAENESLKRQLNNITDSLNKFSKAGFIKKNNNNNLYDE